MNAGLLAFTPFDPWHMLIFGIIALLLFGKRLPEVGRSLGKGIAEFKKGLHDVGEELNKEEPPPERTKLRAPDADYDAGRRLPPEPRETAPPNVPLQSSVGGEEPRAPQSGPQ